MKKKLISLFIACFLMLSCSDNKLSPLTRDGIILAFGDSLTFGVGAGAQKSYPDFLSQITGLQVVNAGVSGETTTQGLKRFQSLLDKHQPELVILMEGGNDILRNHNLATTKKNLSEMIHLAKSFDSQVVMIGVPEKNLFSDSASFYYELADEHQIVFLDEILASLLRSRQYKSDPIHLNAKGYRKLAEKIADVLEASGAIEL
ncbi:GDSL-type esterase/lipase family protein [Aliikangiella sp. G2MR2-5]|uniref:GDSL-type esterase/lipase family protein n=1 Tax=Aliikangiella sp. G2MR2-5 TaxID=2788943 RepID=UPI001FEFB46F|nr:GDSL-type esterase/lipase family protein [Aliikangiella sp. G2MR2-5]